VLVLTETVRPVEVGAGDALAAATGVCCAGIVATMAVMVGDVSADGAGLAKLGRLQASMLRTKARGRKKLFLGGM